MNVHTIVSPPFEENTYIAHREGRDDCVIVDPGFLIDEIIEYCQQNGLQPAAILNTHGHADHIAGNQALKQQWPDCPLVIGQGDAEMLSDPQKNLSAGFGIELKSPPADKLLSEGDHYEAAGFDFEIFEIPGHSAGHIVFVWKGESPFRVFGGDVVFAGSIGRTDFPGGSLQQLVSGIREKLFTLPDDTIIYPGHNQITTVGQEKRTNPFVGGED